MTSYVDVMRSSGRVRPSKWFLNAIRLWMLVFGEMYAEVLALHVVRLALSYTGPSTQNTSTWPQLRGSVEIVELVIHSLAGRAKFAEIRAESRGTEVCIVTQTCN
jgi:hypothetical protein